MLIRAASPRPARSVLACALFSPLRLSALSAMVDIDEVDAENEPLRRHPDSAYHKRPPTLGDRWDAFARCWDHCHMSLAIWVTLVAFTVVIILGIIVLRANQSASTTAFPRCNRIYNCQTQCTATAAGAQSRMRLSESKRACDFIARSLLCACVQGVLPS